MAGLMGTMTEAEAAGRNRDELVLVALGGLGEIGMNAYLYGYGPPQARRWLLVDLGITFPEGEFDPGVDVILPDPKFLVEERGSLAGIVLTHAHEDHIGAVIDLWPRIEAPIYATPFTAGMLKAKAAEFGGRLNLPINIVPMGGRASIGPFEIELVTMSHSIPEPSAIAIRTPVGLALHTGDWKLDQTPFVGEPPDESPAGLNGSARAQLTIRLAEADDSWRNADAQFSGADFRSAARSRRTRNADAGRRPSAAPRCGGRRLPYRPSCVARRLRSGRWPNAEHGATRRLTAFDAWA